MFLDSVPSDYALPVYTSSKVEVAQLTTSDTRRFIRVTLLNERDPFEEVEKFLPPGCHIKDAINDLSLHVDLNVTLDDILALTKQFLGYDERLYGPQEDELGEKGMDPAVYMNSVKQRRKAALRASKAARNKAMPLSEMKEHLTSRGYGTGGSISDIRNRVVQLFAIQAEVTGYGEVSSALFETAAARRPPYFRGRLTFLNTLRHAEGDKTLTLALILLRLLFWLLLCTSNKAFELWRRVLQGNFQDV